jgi:predicted nucleic acid-binding protein
MEISADIAETAGKLRGHYPFLRTMDAIQLGVALEAGVDAFLTNDAKLKQIKETRVLILRDYLL